AAPRVAILDHLGAGHLAELAEQLFEFCIAGTVRKVTDIQPLAHTKSPANGHQGNDPARDRSQREKRRGRRYGPVGRSGDRAEPSSSVVVRPSARSYYEPGQRTNRK